MAKRLLAALMAAMVAVLMLLPGVSTAQVDVNNFWIESFDADYTLGQDEEGRSTLHTREHIVAVFPDYDQNRGLVRQIPHAYDGHSTDLEIVSITDETGAERDFTIDRDGDYEAITIAVPEGNFVRGAQHYVIEYEQSNVTRFFDDTGADEFYWDVNGTDWLQPFLSINARITLEGDLASKLTGSASCYRGSFGSDQPCTITAEGNTFTISETEFRPRENVTFAIGFEPGTFTSAPETITGFLTRIPLLLWTGIGAIVGGLGIMFTLLFRNRPFRRRGAVAEQYFPPTEASVALSGELLGQRKRVLTATILDFAVRGNAALLYDAPTGNFGLRAIRRAGLSPIEFRALSRMLHGWVNPKIKPGTTHWFAPKSTRLGNAGVMLQVEASEELKERGLTRGPNIAALIIANALPVIGLFLLIVHGEVTGNAVPYVAASSLGFTVGVWVLIGLTFLAARRRRLTPRGAKLRDHLSGLRAFMRDSEAERIQVLQSATGADVDKNRVVQVYERLLPYAVLFKMENEWQDVLSRHYKELGRSASDTDSAAQAALRTLHINHLLTRVASAPTSSGSSGSGSGAAHSTDGGSTGGGFSGGGGGGGGGHGV